MAGSTEPTSALLRLCIVLAGLCGAAGITLLAASAHMERSGLVETAAEMLIYHAPALLAIGVVCQVRNVPIMPFALFLLIAGLCLFCGDLVSRSFRGVRLFAMAAPTGGMLLIVGWAAVAFSAINVKPAGR